MRHRKKGRHLSRTAEHRKATMRNLATSLFRHGRIRTTTAKAKELRVFAEPLITKAKRGDLHARRIVAKSISDKASPPPPVCSAGGVLLDRTSLASSTIGGGEARNLVPLSASAACGESPSETRSVGRSRMGLQNYKQKSD
jgi:ribosomal protein L17